MLELTYNWDGDDALPGRQACHFGHLAYTVTNKFTKLAKMRKKRDLDQTASARRVYGVLPFSRQCCPVELPEKGTARAAGTLASHGNTGHW